MEEVTEITLQVTFFPKPHWKIRFDSCFISSQIFQLLIHTENVRYQTLIIFCE